MSHMWMPEEVERITSRCDAGTTQELFPGSQRIHLRGLDDSFLFYLAVTKQLNLSQRNPMR